VYVSRFAAGLIVALVLAGCGRHGTTDGTTHGTTHGGTTQRQTSDPPQASGCGPLPTRLAGATSDGQSVVEAFGALTGRVQTIGPTPYHQMRLTKARTLAGTAQPPTQLVWIAATPQPPPDAADAPGLWASDGHLIAVVTPAVVAHTQLGPLVSTVPVVGKTAVLSAAGCWADPDLGGAAFAGPLREVPRSGTYRLARQAGGFRAVPLSAILRLLPQ
jgi:hypothetical protein